MCTKFDKLNEKIMINYSNYDNIITRNIVISKMNILK